MKFRFKGLQEYANKIEHFSNIAYQNMAIEKAVEKGSEVVEQKQYQALVNLPVDNRPYVPGKRDSITQLQKNALLRAFGASQTQNKNEFINQKTGVIKGKNKLDQSHVTIARRIEYGTSYMNKNPIFSKAARNSRQKCIDAMQESLTESYNDIFNKGV